MGYLQKKSSKKREKHLASGSATADSPEAKSGKTVNQNFSQPKSFFGRRSGTR